ncbi:nucleoside monophosphate kinase [Myxococcota bacterium]|nr:nucleoside monophosphate kinase [Myxococcota bacterium]MBU1498796.1 nucleoside monophosphate kinase [Myxococcota bacterium]
MEVQNIIVTGKSGAGKQPRIDVLIEKFGFIQVSTGNIFRHFLSLYKSLGTGLNLENIWDSDNNNFIDDEKIAALLDPFCREKSTDVNEAILGAKATRFVDAGLFVPDEITNALFKAEFIKNGAKGMILDGYPRTREQSNYLLELCTEMGTAINFIMLVDNEDDAIVKRTTGRRICRQCGKVFHVEFKPPREGQFCTACGDTVIQRSDDTEEKIRTRLKEFQVKTLGAIEVLTSKNIPVVNVPGNLPVFTDEAVRESVISRISQFI